MAPWASSLFIGIHKQFKNKPYDKNIYAALGLYISLYLLEI